VTGIDISERMIAHAQYDAQGHHLHNVQFQVMDARQPLAFPDVSFDAIHARFITGFLSTATWPGLVRECLRLLRPDGWFISTEFEDLGVSTSAALAECQRRRTTALERTDHPAQTTTNE
jgi:ubiquinone/menaquinone biosynthesis C-methylase UbiE